MNQQPNTPPRPLHHPPHIYLDDTWYFITASIYEGKRLLHPEGYKDLTRDHLRELVKEFKLHLTAWVILDNHYHILLKIPSGKELPRFFRRFHGYLSHEINERDHQRGRQVWHNYWDTCIRADKDYWTRFNYIHHNPVKHSYVHRMEDWPYSSYRYYLEHKGPDWLADVFRRYPIVDFTDLKDDLVSD